MEKAIIILSGGMDSTTLLYKLLDEKYEVFALSFDYGQRHKRELELAKKTCTALGVEYTLVDLSSITSLISNSALTGNVDIPEGYYTDENMKLTVVPNRNMIMASIAIGYAVNIGAVRVAIGVHAGDHDIYPDCRKEFIEKLNDVAQIANYEPVEIYAPYLKMDKGDILIEGKKLEVDYSLTHTCYRGDDLACGKCGSCVERLEGFEKAGFSDPIFYEEKDV